MRGRLRDKNQVTRLTAGWEMTLTPPLAVATPSLLGAQKWLPATVPTTAAATLRDAGLWSFDSPRRFDAEDVWFRTRLEPTSPARGEELILCFDGLATVAEVWLNDELLLRSENMFVAHEISLGETLKTGGELAICFRALDELLKQRRPRPRFRAPMVENQQLRWFRTTLLGRTPGWSPPAAPVGPWKEIRLERRTFRVEDVKLKTRLEVGVSPAPTGHLSFTARVTGITAAELILQRDGDVFRAPLHIENEHASGEISIPDAALWWPHTHGEPALYEAILRVRHYDGESEIDLGAVGFRTIEIETANGDFALRINGERLFCRGACWTSLDVVSLHASPAGIEDAVSQARDCGMNMLRISGSIGPECDAFYDACDRHGILLWHDFAFASLDYPNDEAFIENAQIEAGQLLQRLQGRPCVAVLCGNSEGEQQAAMWGASREAWQPQLFHETLRDLSREWCPDAIYWPSSAHGGAFPHQANEGTTSYYGVGAYLQPLSDARRSEVRFATECLTFANVPNETHLKVHSPEWKTRVPRDLGAGWDFDDVRDFYLKLLFGVDPVVLRSTEHDRYLELSRVVTGEVMAAAFAEWRRAGSLTNGALIWFLRDLWPGAGWGVIQSDGTPKAAWHYLRRALAPQAIFLTDEGQSGLHIHVVNEAPRELAGEMEIAFFRDGEIPVGNAKREIRLAPREVFECNALELLDHFVDANYFYRFGPAPHDLVVATLRRAQKTVSQAFFFPIGLPSKRQRDVGLTATARLENGVWILRVDSRAFAQSVRIDAKGFGYSDNYFHIAPGGVREIELRGDASKTPSGTVQPLNSEVSAAIKS
jgi:beta-mannosidase